MLKKEQVGYFVSSLVRPPGREDQVELIES